MVWEHHDRGRAWAREKRCADLKWLTVSARNEGRWVPMFDRSPIISEDVMRCKGRCGNPGVVVRRIAVPTDAVKDMAFPRGVFDDMVDDVGSKIGVGISVNPISDPANGISSSRPTSWVGRRLA